MFPQVHPMLDAALVARGYLEPTEVQAAVLQPEAEGRDLLVSARTGSGKTGAFGAEQLNYFNRISQMKLKHPVMAGFGIHDSTTLNQVFSFGFGAIIGSAYIRSMVNGTEPIEQTTAGFFKSLRD